MKYNFKWSWCSNKSEWHDTGWDWESFPCWLFRFICFQFNPTWDRDNCRGWAACSGPGPSCRLQMVQLTLLTISHSDYRVSIPAQCPVQPSHKLPARTWCGAAEVMWWCVSASESALQMGFCYQDIYGWLWSYRGPCWQILLAPCSEPAPALPSRPLPASARPRYVKIRESGLWRGEAGPWSRLVSVVVRARLSRSMMRPLLTEAAALPCCISWLCLWQRPEAGWDAGCRPAS